MTSLRGITWGHTRGYVPLVAASAAFAERGAGIEAVWDRRSLWAFGEGSIEELVDAYDLLVIDHPFIGMAAERELLLPLDEHLPAAFLREQEAQSVGPSHRSYGHAGRQWALAIDASGQTSALRPDLMDQLGLDVPATWDEVLDLAGRTAAVAIPLAPIDALSSFFSLCASFGEPPFGSHSRVVGRTVGERALSFLAELSRAVDRECLEMNPIRTLTVMAHGDRIAYVPLTYAYSNFSRDGYVRHRITFRTIPGESGATLGGAGLAVSARSARREHALALARWIADAECQRTIYVLSGGQPGDRMAWEDEVANRVTNGFFRSVLPGMERAFLRPTYHGFADFQGRSASVVHDFLRAGGEAVPETLDALDGLYEVSRAGGGGAP